MPAPPILLTLILALLTGFAACQSPSQPANTPETTLQVSTGADTPVQNCPETVSAQYKWLTTYDPQNSLFCRISTPAGYQRVPVQKGSFANWLRYLPLKPGLPEVKLYNGQPKSRQDVHAAVVDLDVGTRDLQQCADAVMRMRAEYLYSLQDYRDIHFNYTNGFEVGFEKWRKGQRPVVNGNQVSWQQKAAPDDSHASFRAYMDNIFNYAGTASLEKEMLPIYLTDLQPGDVFIQGGHPGHAVLILDVAQNETGQKLFLLAQSYMPAQEFHLLKNPNSRDLSPWYSANFTGELNTPEWTFEATDLHRFAQLARESED
ncbi:MAG: DUF4846 domain-containing protein [Bacteroidia bacterium]|nr:DUF4846 domain-containing protein [Bacteroidia bacterium]